MPSRGSNAQHPLLAIVGPTGSGKSDLAITLAQEFDGEIVNCDSIQLYRLFNIGAAKTPPEERRGVPHHLFDVLDPVEVSTAGGYARMARPVLKEIAARGRLPVVVGGTGFYLRALLEGLFSGPVRDTAVRKRLEAREQRRRGSLHRLLRRFDPIAAGRIHPNDSQKLVRAVEVCLLTKRSLIDAFSRGAEPLSGFRILILGLDPPREQLYARLDARCLAMFNKGLRDEVTQILKLGYPPEIKPFESLGYKQCLQLILGTLTFAQALEAMQRSTRRYAKRQLTWFRRQSNAVWLSGFGHLREVQVSAIETVRRTLFELD